MTANKFIYSSTRVTFGLLFAAYSGMWTLGAATTVAVDRNWLNEGGFWVYAGIGVTLWTVTIRWFRTAIIVTSKQVVLRKTFGSRTLPIEKVRRFELCTGRFGVGCFVGVRTNDGSNYISSLCFWQNIDQAPLERTLVKLVDRLNKSLNSSSTQL